jgi:hypothetical protein
MRTLHALARCLLAGLLALPAYALQPLDTRESPRQRIEVTSEWADLSEDSTELDRLVARVENLEYRLDTRAYSGKRVRIYLAMAAATASSGVVSMAWQSVGGVLQAGRARPGERVLVWTGVAPKSSPLVERLSLTFELDARRMAGDAQISPQFFIEALDP